MPQPQRITVRDLADCPLLLREPGSAGRSFLDHVFAVHGITVAPLWESASTQALVKAAAAGLGVAVLPEKLVLRDIANGDVVTRTVADEPFVRDNHIIRHRQKFITPSAAHFTEICRSLRHLAD